MKCPGPEWLAADEMSVEERGLWLDHASTCTTCRAVALVMQVPASSEDESERNPQIGRYIISREIGRGAMGVVYAAEDPELSRAVAVKVLHRSNHETRLRREARALARLTHDNVVHIYDVGVHDNLSYVVMELFAGENLRVWLETPRSLDEVCSVLVDAGRGLAAVHAADIVHRDFKPDNVFVADNGRVAVGDFGLSLLTSEPRSEVASDHDPVIADDRITATGTTIGTPAYMAPEQVSGEATASSDQFAFCVSAWEACFGVRPFEGATLRELRDNARAGKIRRPAGRTVPPRIEKALRRGLSAAPEARFSSMTELLRELAPKRSTRWLWIGAGVPVVGAVIVALWIAGKPSPVLDPCTHDADAILEDWSESARTRLRAAAGVQAEGELDRYVAAWRSARLADCREPKITLPDGLRVVRLGCYDRARVEFAELARSATSHTSIRATLVPLELCRPQRVSWSLTGADARGCGCPYSACDNQTCTSVCGAAGFRIAGPVLGVNTDGQQDAIAGLSSDGTTLLYLSGVGATTTGHSSAGNPACQLDHLFLARRAGERFVSLDLTPQLAGRDVWIGEGCCTLSADGRRIVANRRDRQGFVQLTVDGDRIVGEDALSIVDGAPLGEREKLRFPVVSADDKVLYFTRHDSTPDGDPGPHHGNYVAQRSAPELPFAVGKRLSRYARNFEYVSGVSRDGRTLFMASEFATRVLVRTSSEDAFEAPSPGTPPPLLPGWRAIPDGDCRRIMTTITPGGCAQEDITYLEAVGP